MCFSKKDYIFFKLLEEETHPVDLSSLQSKLLPGFTTLGFKDERRNKGKCQRTCFNFVLIRCFSNFLIIK